jgi:hypothetical protein
MDQQTDYQAKLETILEFAQSAYNSYLEHSRALDTKSSILLAVLGVFMIPAFDSVHKIYTVSDSLNWFSASATALSMLLCLLALRMQKLATTPELDPLQEYYESSVDVDHMRAQLFAAFKEAGAINREIVRRKARLMNVAYWLTITALIAYLIVQLIENS